MMTNTERAKRASTALKAYKGQDNYQDETQLLVQDLLCDLMHFCRQNQLRFTLALTYAKRTNEVEVREDAEI